MEQESLLPAQNKRLSLPNYTTNNEPSTAKIEGLKPSDSEIVYRNPSERIYFSDYMSLALSFDDDEEPLILQPEPMSIFGRVGNVKSEKTVINLSPYEAQYKGVSRLHAVLYRGKGMLQVEDMCSRNGTFVNGCRLIPHELKILHDGDELRLGALIIRIRFQELAS